MGNSIDIKDNTHYPLSTENEGEMNWLSEDEKNQLSQLKNKKETLKSLCAMSLTEESLKQHKGLIVFPHSFKDTEFYSKQKQKEKQTILNLVYEQGVEKICTNNVMGFMGYEDLDLNIHSRFDNAGAYNDYFIYYMLMRISHINVSDFKQSSLNPDDKILDFLMLLFPRMLNDALTQGLFKRYKTYKYNDSRVKGVIDVSRFIREDTPFTGKVAYHCRQFSFDNEVTQLIRHTIEYIKTHNFGKFVLNNDKELRSNIRSIIDATPSYAKSNRQRVIKDCSKRLVHPYFTKYIPLQKLCLQILRHEKLRHGTCKQDEIQGVLFDGAWLWEEYVGTLLKEKGFIHSDNKLKERGIKLFENRRLVVYPDFYIEPKDGKEGIVLDAKYKRYAETDEEGKNKREVDLKDIYQVTSYMYRLKAKLGGFVCPTTNDEEYVSPYEMHKDSFGGKIIVYGINIPNSENSNFQDFAKAMNQSQIKLESI